MKKQSGHADDKKPHRGERPDLDEQIVFNVTSPALSATFIQMSKNGMLPEVSRLVRQHQKLGQRLAIVEAQLRLCNETSALADYAEFCKEKNWNFEKKLTALANGLEANKKKLLEKIRKVEKAALKAERILPNSAKTGALESAQPKTLEALVHEVKKRAVATYLQEKVYVPEVPISLVPNREPTSHPDVEARDRFIGRNTRSSARELCRLLDDKFLRDGSGPRALPSGWHDKFGVRNFVEAYRNEECRPLLQTLISKAKKRYRLTSHT
jgi:hypothetical protein